MDYIFCEYISLPILFEKIITNLTSLNDWTYMYTYIYIENIRRSNWKPCTHTFSLEAVFRDAKFVIYDP